MKTIVRLIVGLLAYFSLIMGVMNSWIIATRFDEIIYNRALVAILSLVFFSFTLVLWMYLYGVPISSIWKKGIRSTLKEVFNCYKIEMFGPAKAEAGPKPDSIKLSDVAAALGFILLILVGLIATVAMLYAVVVGVSSLSMTALLVIIIFILLLR